MNYYILCEKIILDKIIFSSQILDYPYKNNYNYRKKWLRHCTGINPCKACRRELF